MELNCDLTVRYWQAQGRGRGDGTCWSASVSDSARGWPTDTCHSESPAEPHFFSAIVVKNNTVKVEGDDAALDCTRNSRASEKHPLDSVLTALQESSKRKQLGSDGQADSVPSVKRRRLIPEVRT